MPEEVAVFKPLKKIQLIEYRSYNGDELADIFNNLIDSVNVLIEDYMEKYSVE